VNYVGRSASRFSFRNRTRALFSSEFSYGLFEGIDTGRSLVGEPRQLFRLGRIDLGNLVNLAETTGGQLEILCLVCSYLRDVLQQVID